MYTLVEYQGSFMRKVRCDGHPCQAFVSRCHTCALARALAPPPCESKGRPVQLQISTKRAFSKPNNGAFLYQCFTHVAGNYPSFNAFHIDGVSMQQALTKWWEGLGDGKTDREAVVYTDGLWGLDGVATNPTCTY